MKEGSLTKAIHFVWLVGLPCVQVWQSCHGAELYPYGVENGDVSMPIGTKTSENITTPSGTTPNYWDPNFDTSRYFAKINLTLGDFTLFKQTFDHLIVHRNGIISFTSELRGWHINPQWTTGTPLIIPFRGLVETEGDASRGMVYYRLTTNATVLRLAARDVKRGFPGLKGVNLIWALVVTWDKMAFWEPEYYYYLSNCSCIKRRNTFQSILASDGSRSFVIYNYNQIQWIRSPWADGSKSMGLFGIFPVAGGDYFINVTRSFAGFDTGNWGMGMYVLPGTTKPESVANITLTTNIEQEGTWVFRVDREVQSTRCDYNEDVEQIRILPNYAPTLSYTSFKIFGPCLTNVTNVECRFHDNLDQSTSSSNSSSKPSPTHPFVTEGIMATDGLSVTCQGPIIYMTTGRVKVELRFTHDFVKLDNTPSAENKTFFGYIYTHPPDLSGRQLLFKILENGDLSIKWDRNYFYYGGISGNVQLSLIQLDWSQLSQSKQTNNASYKELKVLKIKVPNTGSYTWELIRTVTSKLFKNLRVGYMVYINQLEEGAPVNYYYSWSLGSNIVYTNFSRTNEDYVEMCDDWYQNDGGVKAELMMACPPQLNQARRDWRFIRDWDMLQTQGQDVSECYRQWVSNQDGSGQMCLYGGNGWLIVGGPNGGSADRHSPRGRGGVAAHQESDILPYNLCCVFSGSGESCLKYYEKRPSDPGLTYVAPVLSMWRGDPHITTFDNMTYTFNPVGEFWLVKSPQLNMQARMSPYVNPNVSKSDNTTSNSTASVFSAFAMSQTIQGKASTNVQVSLLPTGIGVWVDKEEVAVDMDIGTGPKSAPTSSTPTQTSISVGDSASILLNNGNVGGGVDRVILAFRSGFTFEISSVDGLALNVIASISPDLKGKGLVSGLLGDFDGSPSNDLKGKDGVQILSNSSLSDIHNKFGLTWRTTKEESIFLYLGNKTHADYQDVTFAPNLKEPDLSSFPKEVRDLCGLSKECLFDYSSTGSLNFAKETKQVASDFKKIALVLNDPVKQPPPTKATPRGRGVSTTPKAYIFPPTRKPTCIVVVPVIGCIYFT